MYRGNGYSHEASNATEPFIPIFMVGRSAFHQHINPMIFITNFITFASCCICYVCTSAWIYLKFIIIIAITINIIITIEFNGNIVFLIFLVTFFHKFSHTVIVWKRVSIELQSNVACRLLLKRYCISINLTRIATILSSSQCSVTHYRPESWQNIFS